jgi:iron complex outermembrane receptor protein
VVYEQYFATVWHLGISGFENDIRGLISQETDPLTHVSFYANLNSARSRGGDVELGANWPNGLQGRLSYTLQRSIDEQTNSVLTNSPASLAKLNVSAPVVRRHLFGSLEGLYTSGVQTLAGTEVAGYFVANATISTPELIGGLTISASAYNVFNKRYANAVGPLLPEDSLEQDGRTLRLKFTYQLGGR